MTTERDPQTRTVLSWLREDAHENAEHVLLLALDEVDTTPQRRPWWPAWRTFRMNKLALTAAATTMVLAIAVIGYTLLPGLGILSPAATPSPSPVLLARGSFNHRDWGPVEFEATRLGSVVTGNMRIGRDVGTPVDPEPSFLNVRLQCARTTEDGLIGIGGSVTDGSGLLFRVHPQGRLFTLVLKRGSPIEGQLWSGSVENLPAEQATDCLANLDAWLERVRLTGPSRESLEGIRGTVELGPFLSTSGPGQTNGSSWPQSTAAEVQRAQARADAGDAGSAWQLDARLAAGQAPWGAEIFAKFIDDVLGWEAFTGTSFAGYVVGEAGGQYDSVLFIRCAAGQANPLSPLYADAPPEIRACAPTIDQRRFETVAITVRQPGRVGGSGIWVVDRWEIVQSRAVLGEPAPPDYLSVVQVEQLAPPSDAQIAELLQVFLHARVDGQGAEQYLLTEADASPDNVAPLLYATTRGASYQRSEVNRVRGPVWPGGWLEYRVRLFAEGETVVEQYCHVVRDDSGRLTGSTESRNAGEGHARRRSVFLGGER